MFLSFSAFSAALICGSLVDVQAAKYIAPDQSKELFKVEKIPLQVDSMKEISRHLTVLASSAQENSPVHRRGSAQLLALAMRLDPANQSARAADKAVKKNEHIQTPRKELLERAVSRLSFFQRWLTNPEAGEDANTLANYLVDATRLLKETQLQNEDIADWNGVLPPLNSYKEEKPSIQEAKPVTPPTAPLFAYPYKINELSVKMPLAGDKIVKYKDSNDNFREKVRRETTYNISTVKLTISAAEQPVFFEVKSSLGSGNGPDQVGGLRHSLKALQARLNKSPQNGGAKASIAMVSLGGAYSSQNGSAATAATQLMLEASRTGKALRADTHLCASLNTNGKLTLPKNFWQILALLREKNGQAGRLIVPKQAIKPLTQLLVYDESDFFVRWEVFSVETIEEAVTIATTDADSKIAEASKLFLSIKNLAQKNAVTKLAVQSAVRKRLSEITSLANNHLSANMLLLQGSGRRPIRLNRLGIAYQIEPTIREMHNILKATNPDHPNDSRLKLLHEKTRAKLDPLEKIIGNSDNELYEQALKISNDIRSLTLVIRRNNRANSNSNRQKSKAMVLKLQDDIKNLQAEVKTALQPATEK